MKVGDTLQDAAGIIYTLGRVLGRGLWGISYIAQSVNKAQCVFKVPYAPKDLPYGKERLAQISRAILIEQGELLSQSPTNIFLKPSDRFTTQSGIPCLRYPVLPSMAYQIKNGISLEHALYTLHQITERLQHSPDRNFIHGNLDLSNVFYHPENGVLLSDPMSPTLRKHLPELLELAPHKAPFFAPEIRGSTDIPVSTAGDVYAMAMVLYRCAMHHKDSEPSLPLDGLTRALKTAFQEQTQRHLNDEESNPRFRTRLSISLGRFIGRALSQPTEPSPPYRFHQLEEASVRLSELNAMFAPYIERVGKIIWNLPISRDCFYVGESIEFSCSVDTSPQLDNYEDISCGLAVIDDATGEPIKEHAGSFAVDTHAGGRLRFSIEIPDLPPSQYTIRAAFRITDSDDTPEVAEAKIGVIPPPGFIPTERPIAEPQTLLMSPNIDPESQSESIKSISDSFDDHSQADGAEPTIVAAPIPQPQPDPNVVIPFTDTNTLLEELNSSADDPSFSEPTLQDDPVADLNSFFTEDESMSAIVKLPHTVKPELDPPSISSVHNRSDISISEQDIDSIEDNVSFDDQEEDSFGVWDQDALTRRELTSEVNPPEETPPPLTQLLLEQLVKLSNDPISMLIAIITAVIIVLFLVLQFFT